MARVAVTAHGTRLLTAALYADKYLAVQIKAAVGSLNQFKSQLATAEVAV